MAYMSEEGYKQLIEELKYLESVERPKIVSAIAEARDKGDLSENAEYDAAKEAQGLLEMKISQLKSTIGDAKIIDTSKMNADTVQILTKVELKNVKTGMKMVYTIVAESEANLKLGKISVNTPIAQGLLGKKVGDVAEITIPQGKISLEFVNVGERSLSVSETEDKDWINNWKQYFKPFTVDDILIKPTWETIPEEHKDKLLIQIDPGTAFGTGMHETTQLCIRQLRKYVNADSEIIDVGTGSGILGIAALKLGAKSVFGTDLDENAIVAVGENLESNNIPADRFHVVQGNIIDDQAIQDQAGYECYDIAAANILAPVIIMLQGEICKHIKHGGMFITSGIINTKEQDVKDAMNANPELEIVETTYQGDWVSITARRK